MKRINECVKKGKPLISDGAWGTMLQRMGLVPGTCPELMNIESPEKVFNIAESYVRAGAQMIKTNSFGGNRVKLKFYGLENRVYEINKAAAQISRQAAGDSIWVLGSMGPTGALLMNGDMEEQRMYEMFSQQACALADGGADAACIETMWALDEALCAVRAVKENTSLEILCTFTFQRTVQGEYRTMMGVGPEDIVFPLREAGAHIIGANCGNGMDGMESIVRFIRQVDSKIPIAIHANAGQPIVNESGATVYLESPMSIASRVHNLINAGADIVGGCCGTGPDHISAIAKKVLEL